MYESIANFQKQFLFKPEIINKSSDIERKKFVLAGMGGSALPAEIVSAWKPNADLFIHRDYGRPRFFDSSTLLVANSYSGNTEETLDAFDEAHKKNIAVAAISSGGALEDMAHKYAAPFVKIPDTRVQPRLALGFAVRALLKIMGDEEGLEETALLADSFNPAESEENGKLLAQSLNGVIPIIYSSARNAAISYIWKISLNETGKVPAFYNVFPELNHNELAGFDMHSPERGSFEKYHVLFLTDSEDHPQIKRRMTLTEELYQESGIHCSQLAIDGASRIEKIFKSVVLAEWAAYFIAKGAGTDPESVPIIENLKRSLRS